VFDIITNSLTVSGPLTGNGTLWMQASTAPLIINGNASAFTGGVLVSTGTFTLNSTIGSGVTNAAAATLTGTGTVNGPVDVSGAFIPGVSNVSVGTFTVNGGLTLEGTSMTTMNLTPTDLTGGTNNSLIAVTGNLTVNGSPTIMVNPIVSGNLVNGTYTIMTYTGSLAGSGSFAGAQTVASSIYTITVNTSNPGLVQLVVTGGPAPVPATFVGPYTVAGSGPTSTLTLSGTGGTDSGYYYVYTSTSLSTPIANWTFVGTGMFSPTGAFSYPVTVNNSLPHFFILEEP